MSKLREQLQPLAPLAQVQAMILKIQNSKSPPLALWVELQKDKALALLAMSALIAWAPTAKSVPPVVLPPAPNREERRRALQATKEVAVALAKQVTKKIEERALDKFMLSSGERLRDIPWYRLSTLAMRSEYDARIIRGILAMRRVTDDNATVGELLDPSEFDQLLTVVKLR